MKRKLLLCTMALCMCTLSPLSVHAETSPLEIGQALQNAEAYMLSPDGERINLEIVDVEVRQIFVPLLPSVLYCPFRRKKVKGGLRPFFICCTR